MIKISYFFLRIPKNSLKIPKMFSNLEENSEFSEDSKISIPSINSKINFKNSSSKKSLSISGGNNFKKMKHIRSSFSNKKLKKKNSQNLNYGNESFSYEENMINNNEMNFETIKSFKYYFPQNNIDFVIKEMKKNKYKMKYEKKNSKFIIIFNFRRLVHKLLKQISFAKSLKPKIKNIKEINFAPKINKYSSARYLYEKEEEYNYKKIRTLNYD